MRVLFDVRHLYYLAQYEPVAYVLRARGASCTFVFYRSDASPETVEKIVPTGFPVLWVADEAESRELYLREKPEWVVFGNGCDYLDELHRVSRSAQMGHGIGMKRTYYTKSASSMSVRFVEGAYRVSRLQAMFPGDRFEDVGFAKLDPIVNGTVRPFDLARHGLDPKKPTILYAPTFYPSSIENFPRDWPALFPDQNVVLKPHQFSLSNPRYAKQRKLLEHWGTFPNAHLASEGLYSIVPLLATASVLVSDASSTLFEFAVLDKPVVWCDFVKLRWTYRGPFAWRYRKRMDEDYVEFAGIAAHAKTFRDVPRLVAASLANPGEYSAVRRALAEKLAGRMDGKASERIADYLFANAPGKAT